MIVVVDTNVLVSGLLSPYHAPGRIVQMIAAGQLRLAYDARILSEYAAVLARPAFAFELKPRELLLDQIRRNGILAAPVPLARNLPDCDDNSFLEVALAASAEYLVTGNIRHFPRNLCRGVNVATPADFLKRFLH